MSSSWTKLICAACALALAFLACGCVADAAADSDLPWATNNSWEGMAPIPGSVLHQYD